MVHCFCVELLKTCANYRNTRINTAVLADTAISVVALSTTTNNNDDKIFGKMRSVKILSLRGDVLLLLLYATVITTNTFTSTKTINKHLNFRTC